jgi:hypothetical protein
MKQSSAFGLAFGAFGSFKMMVLMGHIRITGAVILVYLVS